ncbi:MAG: hypothetical protein LLG14_27410 [Nocardiaceae bacterium]|nr:hypothetical protein [Nocardiaceae bacterium]
MVTSDRPTSAPRAISVEEVEHNATLPTIPPELPARPAALHAGTPYRKGPPALEPPRDYPTFVPDPNQPTFTYRPGHVELTPPTPGVRDDMIVEVAPGTAKFVPHTVRDRSNTPADDVLPNDAHARKAVPAGAVLDYFDSAWVEIAKALQDGNDQHNPGEPLHWSRGKSADHAHCIIRHYLQRGKLSISPTGAVIRHSTYMAIRALMLLQEELEAAGAPLSRGSKIFKPKE